MPFALFRSLCCTTVFCTFLPSRTPTPRGSVTASSGTRHRGSAFTLTTKTTREAKLARTLGEERTPGTPPSGGPGAAFVFSRTVGKAGVGARVVSQRVRCDRARCGQSKHKARARTVLGACGALSQSTTTCTGVQPKEKHSETLRDDFQNISPLFNLVTLLLQYVHAVH